MRLVWVPYSLTLAGMAAGDGEVGVVWLLLLLETPSKKFDTYCVTWVVVSLLFIVSLSFKESLLFTVSLLFKECLVSLLFKEYTAVTVLHCLYYSV